MLARVFNDSFDGCRSVDEKERDRLTKEIQGIAASARRARRGVRRGTGTQGEMSAARPAKDLGCSKNTMGKGA